MSLADRKEAAQKEVAQKNKLPDGTYKVRLSDWEFGKSQKKADMYTLTWKILKALKIDEDQLPEDVDVSDLKGRKVRVFNKTMSDFIQAVGGTTISMAFAEVVPALQRGVVDCAVTGTMSGFTAGWPEVTTHQFQAFREPCQADVVGRDPEAGGAKGPLAFLDCLPANVDRGQVPAFAVPTDHPEPAGGLVERQPPAHREVLDGLVLPQGLVTVDAGGVHVRAPPPGS